MADLEKSLEPEVQDTAATDVPDNEVNEVPALELERQETVVAENPMTETVMPKKTVRNKGVVLGAAIAMATVAVVLFVVFALPAIRYALGVNAYNSGDYTKAVKAFSAVEGYKEADAYLVRSEQGVHYSAAGSLVQTGEYGEAIEEYIEAQDFQDSKDLLKETYILYGNRLVSEKQYDEAITAYRNAGDRAKVTDAYDQKGEALFQDKKYIKAAEAFAAADNNDRRVDCGVALIVEEKDYTNAVAIFEADESSEGISHWNYANGMLSLESEDYQSAVNYFKESSGVLDADTKTQEATFRLAEKCLYEGYLNKALKLYNALPADYVLDNVNAADRIELLKDNQQLLKLVGAWNASDTYYKVKADSTTSSYYYYWYQDGWTVGTVTVTCPYNGDGTFTIKGSATFPSYQNFSTSSSKLKTDIETFNFSKKYSGGSIPKTIGSSSTTKLTFNGKKFSLQYKYVDKYSNVYWHYIYTSKETYGKYSTLPGDV